MTEPELESAIDRAVRDLMSVDADSAFRTRVTARLERPARLRRAWWLGTIATVSAAIAFAVWMRTTGAPIEPRPIARLEAPVLRATPPPTGAALPSAAPAPSPSVRTPDLARRAAAMPVARGAIVAAVAEAPSSISPLAALESIRIGMITQTPIGPAAIDVAPLPPLAEVQISPLEPQTERQ
jgi:hypothetical protein